MFQSFSKRSVCLETIFLGISDSVNERKYIYIFLHVHVYTCHHFLSLES